MTKKIKTVKIVAVAVLFFCLGLSTLLVKKYFDSYRNVFFSNVSISDVVKYYVNSITVTTDTISIILFDDDLMRIDSQRIEAIQGIRNFSYFKGELMYRQETYKIRLRLKGDRIIQYNQDKGWAFRIKVRGDKTIMGMKTFSLHHPKIRNYIHEWFFHKTLEQEDIISLRYEFINVFVNGENWGIYALEEHFDKRLIEYKDRREGLIIRAIEDYGDQYSDSPLMLPYNTRYIRKRRNSEQVNYALTMMNKFRSGNAKVSDIFDAKRMATYFALSDLLGAHHGVVPKSLRFYFNPITGKFEPIGFDGHHGISSSGVLTAEFAFDPSTGWFYENNKEWFGLFFNNQSSQDTHFIEEYVRALEKFSSPAYLDRLFGLFDPDLEKNMALIYKNFPPLADHILDFGPDFFNFSKIQYYRIQEQIKEKLNPPLLLHAFLNSWSEDEVILDLHNIAVLPVMINYITINDSIKLFPTNNLVNPNPNYSFSQYVFTTADSGSPSIMKVKSIRVNHNILGLNESRTTEAFKWNINYDQFPLNPNIEDHMDILNIDTANRSIFFKTGELRLRTPLIIEKGYTVYCYEGTKIDLLNKSFIYSYSPFVFRGSQTQAIQITSSDLSGNGICVISKGQASRLEYVNFSNLGNINLKQLNITGAVTFYESELIIKNCIFSNNRSEDWLNIIRSKFKISDTEFTHSQSDAIDIDFSSGTMSNCSFYNIGGDAIDISGTIIEISNITMNMVDDKGISAGERSELTAENITIRNSKIAITCKDLSVLNLSKIVIVNCEVGFALFQKKSEYGPAQINVKGITYSGVSKYYYNEQGSTLTIDNQILENNSIGLKELLYELK